MYPMRPPSSVLLRSPYAVDLGRPLNPTDESTPTSPKPLLRSPCAVDVGPHNPITHEPLSRNAAQTPVMRGNNMRGALGRMSNLGKSNPFPFGAQAPLVNTSDAQTSDFPTSTNLTHGSGAGTNEEADEKEEGEEDESASPLEPPISPRCIVKLGSGLLPLGGHTFVGPKSIYTVQTRVSEILDIIGLASASAQGLRQPITSGMKLRMHNDHYVYLLIDREGTSSPTPTTSSTNGTLLGMLKVGHKNLFLLDERGQQKEMSPLCVLDFYVHESHQRSGFGKRLFEHMLEDMHVTQPKHLAIDRPSPKLVHFLSKHYGLDAHIRQTNNYVIYQGFFTDRPTEESGAGGGAGGPRKMRLHGGRLQRM